MSIFSVFLCQSEIKYLSKVAWLSLEEQRVSPVAIDVHVLYFLCCPEIINSIIEGCPHMFADQH